MSNLLYDAAKRASHYLESLNTRSVAPEKEAVAALARFDQAFPETASSAEAVLAELDEIGSPATMASAGGRFFAFVIGGALPATVAANWLATTWDQNAGLVVTSPTNAALENISLRWVKEIFHLPVQCAGGFVTCATTANFSALAAARHALLARAGSSGAWVHVDGAFGMWAAAAPARAHLARGVEDADSWATDAHKWLNVPYDSGLVFTRNPDALRKAMSVGGAYLAQDEDRVPYQYTPDFSRRSRGIEIWAALRQLGRPGLADLIERTCRFAGQFAEGLRAAGYRVLNDVVLNQVLVSFGSSERTREVITRVQRDGTCWCGGTVWQGHTAMRISVSSWATTEADVERSLAAILSVARQP